MPADISVYVHFPWCVRKCPYCDFASYATDGSDVPHEAYADAVLRELESRASSLAGRRLVSVFFGGGTPSLWRGEALARVLRGITAAFHRVAGDLEVTAECNPSSLDRETAASFRDAGVGRLSIGVQALDDERLRFLGRWHDADRARRAVRDAVAEVPRVSADLMFGTPGQTPEQLRADAHALLGLGVGHVSSYALGVEQGTRFGLLQRMGKLRVASDAEYAAMYEQLARCLGEAGLAHYEVSNWAVPGEQARHNQHYWRGGAYLGLGAAAVGCLDEGVGRARRWRNDPDPARYGRRAGTGETECETETLDADALVREALMLGLRTAEGADLDDVQRRTGADPLVGREQSVARRRERGDVVLDGRTLRVPHERWFVLDGIVADLF